MAALPTLCFRSQRISARRPSAVLGNVCRCDNERMHASTLSLATSSPTTTRSFCAIIHSLPCSFGLVAHATVRVEEDTGPVPRSPTGCCGLRALRAQIQRRAVLREPPVRTFWQILQTQEHEIRGKPLRREGQLSPPVPVVFALSRNFLARGPRVQRPPGLPCALRFSGAAMMMHNSGESRHESKLACTTAICDRISRRV